jgi:hypothetical protein
VELRRVVEGAGVVDEDVDGAEVGGDARDGLVHLCAVGDVAPDRGRAAAELLDLACGRLGVDEPLRASRLRQDAVRRGLLALVRLDLDVGDDHVGAGARERQRVGAAEPARAARHERDTSGEVDLERHGLRSYAACAGSTTRNAGRGS